MAKKILVVDDEQDIRKVLTMRLKINGLTVITAGDGQEGLEKARSEQPDLILLDLMLPKIDGYEACRLLKFDDRYKHIPIIILSALHEQLDRQKAVEHGADSFFVKPFDFDLLLFKIKSLLNVQSP